MLDGVGPDAESSSASFFGSDEAFAMANDNDYALTGGFLGILITYPAANGFERAMGDAMGAIFPAFDVATSTQMICGW